MFEQPNYGWMEAHLLLIIVKMPTIIAILQFMSRINVMLSIVEHDNFHYAKMSVQYSAMFRILDDSFYMFLIFAQNIDCGYTLEPPQ